MKLIIGWTKIEIFAAQWRHVVFCSLLGSESPVHTGSSQHGIQTTKASDSAVDSSPFSSQLNFGLRPCEGSRVLMVSSGHGQVLVVPWMSDPLYLSSESQSHQSRYPVIGADMTFCSWMVIDCAFA